MRFNIFAALAIFCGLVLTACGGKPEEQIVGTWKIDAAAMQAEMANDKRFKDMPEEAKKKALEQGVKMMASITAEITKDGKMTMNMGKDMKKAGTYKVISTEGNVVTIEATMDKKTEKMTITVDGGKIKMKGPKGPEMVFMK
ncbi:MAG: hypothetical protein ACI9U2_002025 [Bradymonadia bacterium]|jgi:hypothetical protein